uniref:DDE_Tnp_1_7 domain-containing protein n=1 Tax=Strongyloides papillosus TaxID=174720 RepID=A0A0N5C2K1_STREA
MKNHKLFLDNLFTSMNLIQHLRTKGIYVVGTIKKNRVPNGASKKLVDEKILQRRERGSVSIATSSDNISILRWNDNNVVNIISTYACVEPKDYVQRWDRKNKKYIKITRPFAVQQYNKFMGGVDLSDRMVAHYSHSFKSSKFYHRIAFQFLNLSIINSWILYNDSKENKTSLLEFKSSVSNALIQTDKYNTKRGRPRSSSEPPKKSKSRVKVISKIRLDSVGHYPMKIEHKNPSRCHDKNCLKRTRYICEKCKEPVYPECMKSFHL